MSIMNHFVLNAPIPKAKKNEVHIIKNKYSKYKKNKKTGLKSLFFLTQSFNMSKLNIKH